MTVIEAALARGDTEAVRVEGDRLSVAKTQRMARQCAEDRETDIIMEHIGRTNPGAIDAMLAGQS